MTTFTVAITSADSTEVLYASGRRVLVSKFDLGDSVRVDGGDVIAKVTGISIYQHTGQYQVSWWNDGQLLEAWVAEQRIVDANP